MSKYFDKDVLSEIVDSVEKIKEMRNTIFEKHGIDILDNDSISLSTFFGLIKDVDSDYNCNFSRNGEDGYTVINGNKIFVESKSSKVEKSKKGIYRTTSFAFHAKGLINHQAYLFNVWDKNDLKPVRCYYVRNPKNVAKINKRLKQLSEEWSSKPLTKAGYDVIRIEEDMLIKMVDTSSNAKNQKVYLL